MEPICIYVPHLGKFLQAQAFLKRVRRTTPVLNKMLSRQGSMRYTVQGAGGEQEVVDVDSKAPPTPKVARARAAGKKVLIMVQGTRGDIQPIIAFGQALKHAGFVVKFGTNVDHVPFIKKFDLDAVETAHNFAEFMETKEVRECMATGNMAKTREIMGENNKKCAPKSFAQKIELIKNFQPDVMIGETKDEYDSRALANYFGIPVIMQYLYPNTFPSKHMMSFVGEPSCCPHRLLATLIMKMLSLGDKDGKAETMLKQMPEIEPCMIQSLRERMFYLMNPITPVLMAISPSLCHIEEDWPKELKEQMHITGFWVVSKEVQKRGLQRADSMFGGSSLDPVTDFLGKGDAPVYMGWGSMTATSSQHMTCLAVRALMKSRSRGIILGGWAKLDADMLQGQPDTSQMVEYAKENVLFLKTAPHEWLFPQCACTVHHGGAGTTAAALRCGRPTIITPCFGDQFFYSQAVAKAGVGMKMKQLSKVTPAALAQAISKAKDPAMVQAASDMGERLRAEDGLGNAVKALDNWIMENVVTGKHKEKREAQVKMIQQMRAQGEPSCFWWLGRLCCGGDAAGSYSL